MSELKQEDIVDPTSGSPEVKEEAVDPLKTELEKVQKNGKTELEKASFSLKKNAERLAELGGDPTTVLGLKEQKPEEDEDNQPVTRGELKKIIAAGSTKTALQLAEDIEDATERELTKHYLENRINPSGNPQEDLRDARRIVNSVRNEQIAQELARKGSARTHSGGNGVPAKDDIQSQELTPEEIAFTRPPFNLSREQILKARKG